MTKKHLWLISAALLACLWPLTLSPAHAADTLAVTNWTEFKAALSDAHNDDVIELKNHIDATDTADKIFSDDATNGRIKTPILVGKGGCTLRLNGFNVVVDVKTDGGFSGALLGVQPGAELTFVGPGALVNDNAAAGIALVNNGTVTVNHGALSGHDTAFYNGPTGDLTVISGIFEGTSPALHNIGQASITDGLFVGDEGPAVFQGSEGHVTIRGGAFSTYTKDEVSIRSLREPLSALLDEGYGFYEDEQPIALTAEQKILRGNVNVRTNNPAPEPSLKPHVLSSVFTIGQTDVLITHHNAAEGTTARTEQMDVAPYIANGRAMLPLRFVGQSLGATVYFDELTRSVSVSLGQHYVIFNLDSNVAYADGDLHVLDSAPEMVRRRAMLPIGEIADLFGLSRDNAASPGGNLIWDEQPHRVTIVMPVAE